MRCVIGVVASLRSLRALGRRSRRAAQPSQAPAASLPELTQPVNDFAQVIDPQSAAAIEQMSRALKAASGDVVVVATVPTIEPYGDIREYANKLFENHGRGIGDKGKDNGLLILLAMKERQRLDRGRLRARAVDHRRLRRRDEPPCTWCREFRSGRYGAGLRVGTERDHRPHRAGPQRHARGRARPARDGREPAARRCRSGVIFARSSS